jgi:hypothetical protein
MLKTPEDRGGGQGGAADRPTIFAHAEAFRQPRRPVAVLARPEAGPTLPLRVALRLRGFDHQACDSLEMVVVRDDPTTIFERCRRDPDVVCRNGRALLFERHHDRRRALSLTVGEIDDGDAIRDSMWENKETTADVRGSTRHECLAFQNDWFYSARHEASL